MSDLVEVMEEDWAVVLVIMVEEDGVETAAAEVGGSVEMEAEAEGGEEMGEEEEEAMEEAAAGEVVMEEAGEVGRKQLRTELNHGLQYHLLDGNIVE